MMKSMHESAKQSRGERAIRISVITVCFNSAATIEDTLRSVAAQTHAEVEHIVIDGKSTDNTMAIVERYRAGLARVVSEPDRGVYDAMNKGIALATGDVVGFLNADDVFADTESLASIAAAFDRPEADACYADLVYVDKDDTSRVVRYWKSRDYRPGLARQGWMPAHPTFYVRRRVYQQHGGFDLQYRFQSDFDLTTRLLEVHRIKSVYIPRILIRMRAGGMTNNSYMNILKGNLEAYRACRNNGLDVGPWFILQKILSRLPQFFARQVGK